VRGEPRYYGLGMRGIPPLPFAIGLLCFAASSFSSLFAQDSIERDIAELLKIGREGEGNESASVAASHLSKSDADVLLPILRATGKGSPVADNWLRGVANTIVDRALKAKASLPMDPLMGFIRDTSQLEAARILAFDLLSQADASVASKLEEELRNDPVQSLRRGAVAKLTKAASSADPSKSKQLWMEALSSVRDEDQTKTVVEALRKLGVEVDVPKHFGFLTHWHVMGPFENTERKGFETAFAPEKEMDLGKSYEGKGKTVTWQAFESKEEYGKVDLNKPLTALKEATAYAFTSLNAPEERDVELRLGCKNAWKIWLNGKLLFSRDEYHRGQKMDQYKLKCRLKKGPNSLLVKCCQNEQTESWTVEWEFQLRVCDSAGTGIAFQK
jgi:hypothetical protein